MIKLNIALVGYGGMGSYHARELIPREKNQFEILGVFDTNPTRQKIALENNLYAYESFEEILADERADIILIATPNDVHKEYSIRALQAGKHVICEKPVTLNAAEFADILQEATESKRVFMVHQNRRWDNDFLVLKELYEQEHLGKIFQIESRVHGANGIPGDWRAQKKHGGGMLLDWGVHLIDQLLWLVQSPIKNIHAHLSYVLGNDSDDGFLIEIIFENDLRAIIEVATTNYISLPRWYIKGYDGTAIIENWDLMGKIIKRTDLENLKESTPIQAGAGLTKTMAPPTEEAIVESPLPDPAFEGPSFYQNFYAVVVEGAAPIVKNSEVREVMQLIDLIFQQYS